MKLLQKTVGSYLLYSVFILLVAIPVFYLTIQNVLRHETDEELLASIQKLKPRLASEFAKEHGAGHFIDPNISIEPVVNDEVRDTLYTIEEYDFTEKEMIPFRVIRSNITINGKQYLLTRQLSLLENHDLIKTIVIIETILLILLMGGLLVIHWRLSLNIWRPFYRTLEKLRNFKVEKDAELGLSTTAVNEFNDLNESLESLARRTHQAFISQKEFTENASHEMQTPLAILQGKLELLMQTPNLTEEQATLMDELADASLRMTRLNKSLVLLTKIENNQFHDLEEISLKPIIENFIQRQYQSQIDQKQLQVKMDLAHELRFNGNKMLTEILIGNLLANAIRHNVINGEIYISTADNLLTVANTGKGKSLDEDRIFNRFHKDETNSESLGLGLEIARRISELHGYQLSYRYSDQLHQFTIRFVNVQ